MTTTMVYHAAVRGIDLEEVESELEGDIDLKGFLAISAKVRPGDQEIRVNLKVKTDIKNVDRLKALSRLSPGGILMNHAAKITSPHTSILLFQLGGALARFGETDTPAGNRNAAHVLNVAASWEDPTQTEEQVAWSRACWSAMQQFSTGGVNVNFLTGEEGDQRVRAAYGAANYERLVVLKNKYDPQNMFRLNQNIPPSV
jgi:hypothetical protein